MKVRQYDQTPPARSKRRPSVVLVVLTVASALGASACTNDGEGSTASGGSTQTAAKSLVKTIPQPILDKNLQVAPENARVDVAMPSFPDPTSVTNPLFPVSKQESVLLLGRLDRKPFRTEVTLLPYTRMIEWEGQQIETLTSQYVAYLGGRITEVAVDQYAQADDGSVWYFGEDVSDFRHGAIVTKEGTWTVGKDGPAAMVMPGDPKVGVVHRAENIPGIAFEEVTVRSVDQTLDGPVGPVKGGIVGEELHMDGSSSEKVFGPGYGEFYTAHGGDIEALALAVPTDALSGPTPAELVTLKAGAESVFDAAESKDWSTASAAVDDMTAAWAHMRPGRSRR